MYFLDLWSLFNKTIKYKLFLVPLCDNGDVNTVFYLLKITQLVTDRSKV